MPELPDVVVYIEALAARVIGQPLAGIRLKSAFVLRSVSPRPEELAGREVRALRRLGKRIVFACAGDAFIVIHLMIAGRLHWRKPGASVGGRDTLAAFDFPAGSVVLTEAGRTKRASIHLVQGEDELAAHDPGGIDPLAVELAAFHAALARERHTLKRALTDPRTFSGIGNAYSDEILHRAKLSPFKRTDELATVEVERLYAATQAVLSEWTERLRAAARGAFPEGITAFREGMAVHGRFRQPCPDCGAPVQRIVYAQNEANYCARCQTGGRLLADRALSRLLRGDWPRTLEELEARRR